MRSEKKAEQKNTKQKFVKFLKILMFIVAMILSYFVTEELVNYVSTLDIQLIKRIVNIIFVVIIAVFTFKK